MSMRLDEGTGPPNFRTRQNERRGGGQIRCDITRRPRRSAVTLANRAPTVAVRSSRGQGLRPRAASCAGGRHPPEGRGRWPTPPAERHPPEERGCRLLPKTAGSWARGRPASPGGETEPGPPHTHEATTVQETTPVPRLRSTAVSTPAATTMTTACHCGETGGRLRPTTDQTTTERGAPVPWCYTPARGSRFPPPPHE